MDEVSEDTVGKVGNDNDGMSGIGEPLHPNESREKGGRLEKYMSYIDSQPSHAELRPDETSFNEIAFSNDMIDHSTQSYLKNKNPRSGIEAGNIIS